MGCCSYRYARFRLAVVQFAKRLNDNYRLNVCIPATRRSVSSSCKQSRLARLMVGWFDDRCQPMDCCRPSQNLVHVLGVGGSRFLDLVQVLHDDVVKSGLEQTHHITSLIRVSTNPAKRISRRHFKKLSVGFYVVIAWLIILRWQAMYEVSLTEHMMMSSMS